MWRMIGRHDWLDERFDKWRLVRTRNASLKLPVLCVDHTFTTSCAKNDDDDDDVVDVVVQFASRRHELNRGPHAVPTQTHSFTLERVV